MAQILVWKCDHTGALFEERDAYTRHVKELAKERARQKRYEAKEAQRMAVFAQMRATCANAQDIENFIKANFESFVINEIEYNHWPGRAKDKPSDYCSLLDIKINLYPVKMLRASHSAPIGHRSKFTDSNHKFAGIHGSMIISHGQELKGKTKRLKKHIFTKAFDGTGINTGTASGGDRGFNSDFDLWLADWPLFEQDAVLTTLS